MICNPELFISFVSRYFFTSNIFTHIYIYVIYIYNIYIYIIYNIYIYIIYIYIYIIYIYILYILYIYIIYIYIFRCSNRLSYPGMSSTRTQSQHSHSEPALYSYFNFIICSVSSFISVISFVSHHVYFN